MIPEKSVDIILDATVSGSSRPDIARMAKCTATTVWNYQKRSGLL